MFSIDTPKCRLRAIEPSDVELLYIWENDPEVWRVSGTMAPLSLERLARFIEEQSYDIYATRQMRLVIDIEGIAVGSIDLFEFDPNNRRFGIGILIYTQERRHGYARAAIEAIRQYGIETLGVKQIWASIAADNEASISLFESCGFEQCGRRRAWLRRAEGFVDQLEYQLIVE
ncbi:MAG: GNAT family N-acetyltransferase [Alistipes sp.]|nr:GNAT family N-acetyltransferase [Alistipes sp.]